ncbi:hypothetical protein Lalb_Chr04g0250761 [Lupinus albus]|uniref:Uncharacterized protein n=1 Tax=Lupinus albus TaxID=3870 RepID=A0A6A4QM05_LUPAL|nr:hypothetical protein Lalb_Chr04g0250761 [Lupinus albus]
MDLTVGTARWTGECKFSDPGRVMKVVDVLKREAERSDEGFWGIGGFGMEDLKSEEGIVERVSERESEPFVPDGFS